MSTDLYWDIEITPEEEDEIIKKIAERMHKYGMNVPAILLLETFKPLSYIGSQMGFFFISPFLPIFGEEIGLTGNKLLKLLEDKESDVCGSAASALASIGFVDERVLASLKDICRNYTEYGYYIDDPEGEDIIYIYDLAFRALWRYGGGESMGQ